MGLRERMARSSKPTPLARAGGGPKDAQKQGQYSDSYQELKTGIHQKLIDRLDVTAIAQMDREAVAHEIRLVVEALLSAEKTPLSRQERERIIEEVQNETMGFGPLESLLKDPEVTDILVNSGTNVYIERFGRLERTNIEFKDNNHLKQIIDRIVAKVGRRIDEASPMCDARLPDGSRVNAIIPPLALDGPALSIRKFFRDKLQMEDLIELGTATRPMGILLRACVRSRLNILISGGTGTGKTTLLNILSSYVPANERIITVEDSAELQLHQDHVVRLETRPMNIEGKGEVTQRDLVKNCLRMRPDRIILGEVRGSEVLDMLQAMNTGHDGSLATIHANNAKDALHRLEMMVLLSGVNMPERTIREQVSSAIHLVVQATRFSDGTRKVTSISEIVGVQDDSIVIKDIWIFDRRGLDRDGRVVGSFQATGYKPHFLHVLRVHGEEVPDSLFQPGAVA